MGNARLGRPSHPRTPQRRPCKAQTAPEYARRPRSHLADARRHAPPIPHSHYGRPEQLGSRYAAEFGAQLTANSAEA